MSSQIETDTDPKVTMIHPTAIVDPGAIIGAGVEIGPYAVVGDAVELADNVVLKSHAVVHGRTYIGARSVIYPFASIGHAPQDLKFKGEPSALLIGANNTIREHVTMNPGTEGGGMVTRVGDNGLFMTGCHIGHDCQVGNGVVFANNATLAGHVIVEDQALIGGLAAVHQFVRIGRLAMVGGMTGVERDVIPYGSVMGDRARLAGLNWIGLQRQGFSRTVIHGLRQTFKELFSGEGTFQDRVAALDAATTRPGPERDILDFILAESDRAICQPRPGD
jgi:UDP-N-acetylglucosamine acyltransferase